MNLTIFDNTAALFFASTFLMFLKNKVENTFFDKDLAQ